ncbi:unnamed protein product [Arctia plantaginis]|uniref:Protein takeout-like n=1 Tax=Arctia plantaginis TaxID=874455 RepID=A0A8S1B871_ARCPL|nr:unnamed protein product [Arctia plantaginis]
MYRHIILLFCVFVRVQPYTSLQKGGPCGKYDNNCVTKTSNNIFKKAVDGDPSANFKSLEPLKVKHIEGKFGIINYDLYNNSLVGLKKCDIVDTQLMLEQKSMQIKLICPYLYFRGIYEVSGYLILVPIEGKGDYRLETKDYHIYIDTETKIIQAEDGTKYLNFKSFKVTGDLRGGMVIDLKNLFNGQHKELAANIKPCKTYDTTCVTNTANNIFGIAINGDTSMNIERLDPIKHKYIEGNLAIIKYKLFNSTIVGFKDCNIVDANVTLEDNSMHFKLICPYLYMYGKYEMSGLLVSVPIEGKGDYTLSAKDYHIFIETQTKVNKGSDGKNYINIKNFIVNGDLKGELDLDLKNLFNGEHEELADAALKFAHDQSKVVSKLLQGPIVSVNIKSVIKNMNKYLKNQSLDTMLII